MQPYNIQQLLLYAAEIVLLYLWFWSEHVTRQQKDKKSVERH